MDRIYAKAMRLTDEHGRERIFSGVNVVDKSVWSPGRQAFPFLNEDVLRRFAANGWNLIRLGFTWAKIEPQIGVYNEAYLDSVSDVLDWCAKYGVYVMLDMHQDLFSAVTNGDGAPPWAALTDGARTHPTRFVWAEDYFWGKACHRSFDHFWANAYVQGRGLQDRFADCWAHLARRFAQKEAVIGFDVFNEPFPGTVGGACFRRIVSGTAKAFLSGKNMQRKQAVKALFSPDRAPQLLNLITYPVLREATRGADETIAAFDRQRYSLFLQRVSRAIRATDTDKLILLENNYYSNLGIPCAVQPVRGEDGVDSQQAFAPHAYDFMVDTSAYKWASDDRVGGIFAEHRLTQQRLQMPVIVGEWGGFGADDDDTWLRHIAFLLSLFDRNKWSHAYWQFSDTFFTSPLMRVFIRPYPQAVCGEIGSYAYDPDTRTFRMRFSQTTVGESVLCTPFSVQRLTLDGDAYAFRTDGAQTTIDTQPGQHTLEIQF